MNWIKIESMRECPKSEKPFLIIYNKQIAYVAYDECSEKFYYVINPIDAEVYEYEIEIPDNGYSHYCLINEQFSNQDRKRLNEKTANENEKKLEL